jgi:hypothetical protein
MTSAVAANSLRLAEFRERVQRCQQRAVQSQRRQVQVRQARARIRRSQRTAASPVAFLLAVLTGGVAVIAARYGRAIWTEPTLIGPDPRAAMLTDLIFALMLGLVLKSLLSLPGHRLFLGQVLGAALMLVSMHNLVHLAPDLWARAFPSQWVAEVLQDTQPQSLLIQGRSYRL